MNDYKQGTFAYKVHHSARWARLAQKARRMFPVCCNPYQQHGDSVVEPSEQVHHTISIENAPHLAFELTNLCPLCARCHEHLTTLERRNVNTVQQVLTAFCKVYEMDLDDTADRLGTLHSSPSPCQGSSPYVSERSKVCRSVPPRFNLGWITPTHRGVPSQKFTSPPTGHGVLPSPCDTEGGGDLQCVKSGDHFFCGRMQRNVLTRCGSCKYHEIQH